MFEFLFKRPIPFGSNALLRVHKNGVIRADDEASNTRFIVTQGSVASRVFGNTDGVDNSVYPLGRCVSLGSIYILLEFGSAELGRGGNPSLFHGYVWGNDPEHITVMIYARRYPGARLL
jgi:hypothetical protein